MPAKFAFVKGSYHTEPSVLIMKISPPPLLPLTTASEAKYALSFHLMFILLRSIAICN